MGSNQRPSSPASGAGERGCAYAGWDTEGSVFRRFVSRQVTQGNRSGKGGALKWRLTLRIDGGGAQSSPDGRVVSQPPGGRQRGSERTNASGAVDTEDKDESRTELTEDG